MKFPAELILRARPKSKALRALGVAAVASLLCLGAWWLHWSWFVQLEFESWAWRARWLARPSPATERIKLVFLDQETLAQTRGKISEDGGSARPSAFKPLPWPWPREIYAALLRYFATCGAKSVAFDLLFTEPSAYGVEDDGLLRDAMAGCRNFICAMMLEGGKGEDTALATAWPSYIRKPGLVIEGLKAWLQTAGPGVRFRYEKGIFPVEDVVRLGPEQPPVAMGNVNAYPDRDDVIRKVRLFNLFQDEAVPSLALASYLMAYPGTRLKIEPGRFWLDNHLFPIDREGYAWLRFRGPCKVYRPVRALAVLQSALLLQDEERLKKGEKPALDPSYFRDCHVFFGFSAPGLFDLKTTAVGGQYPGVGIHATALDNLLAEDFVMTELPWPAIAAVTLLLSFLASLGAFSSWKLWQNVFAIAGFLSLACALSFAGYEAGYWIPMTAQFSAVLLSLIASISINYATEGRQKHFIKGAFRQYLSPVVIDQLIDSPEKLALGGERRLLTMFFSDLQGFSGFSERLDPVALTRLLNAYLTEMTGILYEEGATIDKYVGDAIVAFWNAPLDQADHAERGVRAALRCQRRLAELQPGYREQAGQDLVMRIGLHTGPVVVGNMGSNQRFNYTILGDAANLASRLEGVNKTFGTSILISGATRELLGPGIACREISRIVVVGRQEPVRIFEPMTLEEEVARAPGLQAFAEGRKQFYAGNPGGAVPHFRVAEATGDSAAKKYLAKCQELLAGSSSSSPRPKTDSGVWVMTEK